MSFSVSASLQNIQNQQTMLLQNLPPGLQEGIGEKTSIEKQQPITQSTSFCPKLISSLDRLVEVVEGVFDGIFPHLITVSPWFLSRTVNLRIFSITAQVFNIKNPLLVIKAMNQDGLKHREPLSSCIRKLCSKIRNFSIKTTISSGLEKYILKRKDAANLTQVSCNKFYKIKRNLKRIIDLPPHQKIIGTISAITLFMAPLDHFNILPQNIPTRLTVDSLLLATTILGGASSLISGTRHINMGYNYKTLGLKARTSHIVSGAILTALGIASMHSVGSTISKLAAGLPIFYGLDSGQQEGILKHKALHTLSTPKTCNAVIIDGMSSEWGKYPDDISSPSSELIYDKCHVRYYRTGGSEEFCHQLKQASRELGNIDLLSINGHANSEFQVLNRYYYLDGGSTEWSCIDESLAENAQIAIMGCNTATLDNSLSQMGSSHLSGKKEVSGFASFYNPFVALNSYTNGRFEFESLLPLKSTENGEMTLTTPFNSRSFIKGVQI